MTQYVSNGSVSTAPCDSAGSIVNCDNPLNPYTPFFTSDGAAVDPTTWDAAGGQPRGGNPEVGIAGDPEDFNGCSPAAATGLSGTFNLAPFPNCNFLAFPGEAFSQTTVDDVVADFYGLGSAAWSGLYVDLSGGTSATPSDMAAVDAILTAGGTVIVNGMDAALVKPKKTLKGQT